MASPLPTQIDAPPREVWRAIQAFVWLIGFVMFTCLIFLPPLGLLLFWNVLIPIAPFLMVVAVGVWRNVCPLATVVLLPRHLGLSKRRIMSTRWQARLGLVGVLLLYAIVPMRHALFNTDGPATALLIGTLAAVGFVMGTQYEWKSAWCSTLCPVHAVEKLYGSNVVESMPNAHCTSCMNCVVPCPDSTANLLPSRPSKHLAARVSGLLISGGLPGFVWGWFHVPDHIGIRAFGDLTNVYAMPLIGLVVSILLYLALRRAVDLDEPALTRAFAAAAVSCYYWYRIPALLGFGSFVGDGLLVDAHAFLPDWLPSLISLAAAGFFIYWIVYRPPNRKSWVVRPSYAGRAASVDRN